MPNFISEDQIEQALVQKLQYLHGFDALDCYTENAEDLNDSSGRANKRDVILVERVREPAGKLRPRVIPGEMRQCVLPDARLREPWQEVGGLSVFATQRKSIGRSL